MNLRNRTSRLIITTQLYAYVVYAIIYRTLAPFFTHSEPFGMFTFVCEARLLICASLTNSNVVVNVLKNQLNVECSLFADACTLFIIARINILSYLKLWLV